MNAGKLDRLVQFRRYEEVDDGFGESENWQDHGPLIHASKTDVSDAERWRAGEVSANITTRFVVRWTSFTRDITPKDRMVCEGLEYDITGVKEGRGRRQWIEITTSARSDK